MKLRKLFFISIFLFLNFYLIINFLSFLFISKSKLLTFESLFDLIVIEKNISLNCESVFEEIKLNNSNFNSNNQLRCPGKDWIDIKNDGTFSHNRKVLKELNIEIEECVISNIKWKTDDFDYLITSETKINDQDKVNKNESIFVVKCVSKNYHFYESTFAKIFQNPKETKINNPFNVLFIGFDSVSLTDFFENLPLSSDFLKNKIKTNILSRYNIVGDGSPAALIPLLTSKHENELPNTIRGTANANYVDEAYPFIWRNFSEYLNYSTSFLEEWPQIGTFQYRMLGMKNPPTDYYMRQFLLARESKLRDNQCIGARTNIKFYLDYINEFSKAYSKTGFYGLNFICKYSHDADKQFLKKIDSEFNDFLREFHTNKKIYGNTILVIFSDHGPRFSHLRKSVQGLLNERNPFFSIYLPKSFQNKYPIEFENFQSNSDKLVTPMDIHRTFMSLIDLETGKKEENINETSPNNGIYEATITGEIYLNNGSYNFQIDKNQISRINKYGSDSHCIFYKYHEIRKYCYCITKF